MEELLGCWREAQRGDKAALHLLRLRMVLGLEYTEHINAVLREVESSSRLLRDLYDLVPIYRARVAMIVYFLNVILPSLYKTLRDMMIYMDNDSLTERSQWTLMCDRMGEQGKMTLAARHVMYNEFLVQLIRLLGRSVFNCAYDCDWRNLTNVSRSPLHDPTALDVLRKRILRLRLQQGINGMALARYS